MIPFPASPLCTLVSLFRPGDTGFLYSSMMPTILLQTAGGVPVASDADPIGLALDQSSNGINAAQPTASNRPTWYSNSGKPYLKGNSVNQNLLTTWNPTSAGCLAVAARMVSGGESNMGARLASSDRLYIGSSSTSTVAGGVGSQSNSVIYGGSNIVGTDIAAVLTWSGSAVALWCNGVSVYSAAQSGTTNPGVPVAVCAVNNNGTISGFSSSRFYAAMAISRVPDNNEITNIITPALRSTYP